jgi:hypothetical protein
VTAGNGDSLAGLRLLAMRSITSVHTAPKAINIHATSQVYQNRASIMTGSPSPDVCERVKSPPKRAAAPTTLTSWSPRRLVRESWHKIDFASHIDRMAEISRHHLEVIVVARDDSWEWQVQSQGTVLVTGTGRTRLLARFLGNDARLRLLAEGFGNP